jgi:chromosomal replication initiator protein
VSEQLEPIWREIRAELREQTPDFKFHLWLEPLELAGSAGSTLYVRAPEHIRTWVTQRYLPLLRDAACRRFDAGAIVEVVGEGWQPPEAVTPPASEPAGAARATLNPKYSFEQFVIGDANRFAHAASLAVAELPAQAYNPLFLHGPPGVGKTHLLHAIGNYVERYGSGLRVRYATVEEFTGAFVDAIRSGDTTGFKRAFREVDVVLIDDVQFLARKERTREEFFHLFNALLDSGRQLVMTSDRRPEELADLEERLIERFRSGLVVELEPPSVDVRRAILHKRAQLDDVELSEGVLEEIATRVSSSVRALEGALIRVVAYASLKGEKPTPELARRVLKRLGQGAAGGRCTLAEVLDAAAGEFGVSREALRGRSRRPDVAAARHVAMYLAHELSGQNYSQIAREMQRDPSTVLHAVNRVSLQLGSDPGLRGAVDNLRIHLRPTR